MNSISKHCSTLSVPSLLTLCAVLAAAASACGDGAGGTSPKTTSDSSGTSNPAKFEELDPSVCAADAGPFTLRIDNPYFPLPVGRKLVLEGVEDGKRLRVELTVLKQTEEVDGTTTRVVERQEFENGSLVKISRNFFAQAEDGTVCYFGAEVENYENGAVAGKEGSWRAGEADARPGILMPGQPRPGTQFAQERAPGVAEDKSAILAVGAIDVPDLEEVDDAVRALDWNPLEEQTPEEGDEQYYARGVGLVIDGPVRLTSELPEENGGEPGDDGAEPEPSPSPEPDGDGSEPGDGGEPDDGESDGGGSEDGGSSDDGGSTPGL